MAPEQLTRFTHLVEFLGMTLGPDYEIVLHEIDRPTPCVVAIANGQISGRTVGAPLTNVALDELSGGICKRSSSALFDVFYQKRTE